VGTIGRAQYQTFHQIRNFITARFPMMVGPLIVNAVGDGIRLEEDLIQIHPGVPLGNGTVMEYVARHLSPDTIHVVQPPSAREDTRDVPMILMSMKIIRPMCAHMAQ
jgi:hypothetical protein